jgi:hypothetical protein
VTTLSKWLAVLCLAMACVGGYGLYRENIAKATLKAQTQAAVDKLASIQKADSDRQAELQVKYNALQQVKQQTKTVYQIIHELPKQVALPDNGAGLGEITAKQADAATTADAAGPSIHAGDMVIPQIDAKPLFDKAADDNLCKIDLLKKQSTIQACTESLAVKDSQIKQRDIVIAGGTKWSRAKTATKWGTIGAAIGAGIALYLTHK